MYISAFTKPHRIREIPRYLYKGQEIITDPESGVFDTKFVVIYAPDEQLAEDLVNRLSSGLIGAKNFEKEEDAVIYGRKRE